MVLVGAGFLKIGSGNAVADITAVFGSRSSVATHDRTGIRIADAKGFGVKNTIVTKGDRRTVDGFEGIAKFGIADVGIPGVGGIDSAGGGRIASGVGNGAGSCLLYTSDAADDLLCVDLGGRRIIKNKIKIQ